MVLQQSIILIHQLLFIIFLYLHVHLYDLISISIHLSIFHSSTLLHHCILILFVQVEIYGGRGRVGVRGCVGIGSEFGGIWGFWRGSCGRCRCRGCGSIVCIFILFMLVSHLV